MQTWHCAGGIPTIAVSISHDLLHWTLVNTSWVVPDAKHQEMWVEAGSPPQQLQDGNYIMSESLISRHSASADPQTTVTDQPRDTGDPLTHLHSHPRYVLRHL